MDLDEAAKAFREFVEVVKALRTPGSGCPWDLEQDHRSLRPYLVEEAYEVLDAIDRGQDRALREELGDLLLQVVLHAQLADDRGAFDVADVVRGITEKMVRRHPHVFGSTMVSDSADVMRNWEQIKAAEKPSSSSLADALERLPPGLPALLRAQRIGEKAARARIDAESAMDALAIVRKQLAELEREIAARDASLDRLDHDLGEVLFNLAQLVRHLGLNAEDSLRGGCGHFIEHVRRLEKQVPGPLTEMSTEELAVAWGRSDFGRTS